MSLKKVFNAFLINIPILYPLKTPKNQRSSAIFRGYILGTLATNGLTRLSFKSCFPYRRGSLETQPH